MCRWASGGMIRSALATRYQLGLSRQAAADSGVEKLAMEIGTCASEANAASVDRTDKQLLAIGAKDDQGVDRCCPARHVAHPTLDGAVPAWQVLTSTAVVASANTSRLPAPAPSERVQSGECVPGAASPAMPGQARSTYSIVSVETMIASPSPTKGGTMTRRPLSSTAGLKLFAAVWPFTAGSVSTMVQVTFSGR